MIYCFVGFFFSLNFRNRAQVITVRYAMRLFIKVQCLDGGLPFLATTSEEWLSIFRLAAIVPVTTLTLKPFDHFQKIDAKLDSKVIKIFVYSRGQVKEEQFSSRRDYSLRQDKAVVF